MGTVTLNDIVLPSQTGLFEKPEGTDGCGWLIVNVVWSFAVQPFTVTAVNCKLYVPICEVVINHATGLLISTGLTILNKFRPAGPLLNDHVAVPPVTVPLKLAAVPWH